MKVIHKLSTLRLNSGRDGKKSPPLMYIRQVSNDNPSPFFHFSLAPFYPQQRIEGNATPSSASVTTTLFGSPKRAEDGSASMPSNHGNGCHEEINSRRRINA